MMNSGNQEPFVNLPEVKPKTLYVGNLDSQMTEEFLVTVFSAIGEVKGCKIINEPNSEKYAFVEFVSYEVAAAALLAMNKRVCFEKEMKVNWATNNSVSHSKTDTSKHFHVFVGDLSPEIDTSTLCEAFGPFGEISDCRIVRDPQTLKSKGYGFVSFVNKSDAEKAIHDMNGQWIGTRSIRTNWASKQPPFTKNGDRSSKKLKFDDVWGQSSPTNSTVYCGGFSGGLGEQFIHDMFSPFGQIQEIRIFREKGFAFIKFFHKECAANAIVALHHTEVNGETIKCSWGKETEPDAASANMRQTQLGNYSALTNAAQNSYANAYAQQAQAAYWGYPTANDYSLAQLQMQNQLIHGMQNQLLQQGFGFGGGYQQQLQQANYLAVAQSMSQFAQEGEGSSSNGGSQHHSNANVLGAPYSMQQFR